MKIKYNFYDGLERLTSDLRGVVVVALKRAFVDGLYLFGSCQSGLWARDSDELTEIRLSVC